MTAASCPPRPPLTGKVPAWLCGHWTDGAFCSYNTGSATYFNLSPNGGERCIGELKRNHSQSPLLPPSRVCSRVRFLQFYSPAFVFHVVLSKA